MWKYFNHLQNSKNFGNVPFFLKNMMVIRIICIEETSKFPEQ